MTGKKQKKEIKEKGITLIALVVTIIVLIILATVSINMVVGENGLIKKAEQARDAYEESSKKEVEGINTMLEEMMKETGVGPHGLPLVDTLGGGSSNVVLESTVDAEDVYGNRIVVPRGFFVRTDLGTKVNDGIVIEDADGNQFVWVPCTKKQYEDAKHAVMKESWSINEEYKTNGDNTGDTTVPEGETKGPGYGWRDNYTEEDKNKLNETYKNNGNTSTLPTEKWVTEDQIKVATESIEKNGGFYIARYEAGVPSDATFSIKDNNLGYYTIEGASHTFTKEWANDNAKVRGSYGDTESIKELKPVSKQGVQAWNYITQPNSKLVAENMYNNDDVGVRSYLVDSQAWNHICKNIFEGRQNITNSSSWGNYYDNTAPNYEKINGLYAKHKYDSNNKKWTIATTYTKGKVEKNTGTNRIELATGSSDDFKLYNIYDMAGNMWEWTTGHNIKNNQMYVVERGGSFCNDGADFPVVHALGNDVLTHYNFHVGFRVVLYVK